jgi:hypothetical protein
MLSLMKPKICTKNPTLSATHNNLMNPHAQWYPSGGHAVLCVSVTLVWLARLEMACNHQNQH